MSIIFMLIIISLLLATGFLIAFIRATRSGQFDDPYTPSVRMLWDDDEAPEEDKKEDANPEEVLKEGTENDEETQQNNEIITKKKDSE
ncbi:MAG: cbb3-type cytochrome oxidase assembly protein CcoS [Bacteroidales bacterium]|jgi:cbb3-type cytochrome oxidase maturation protein|nr:cbb3-type cytochrome oxidase assembly protein CcoS [Bacteroidales bacterium]